MEIHRNKLGIISITRRVYADERGSFSELFRADSLKSVQIDDIVQINTSISKKGVLRGMHYQKQPKEQGKLVTVIYGKIYDVAVDIRQNSRTFGTSYAEELSNGKMLYIPRGFAHGFLALEDSVVVYGTTEYYEPDMEAGFRYDDERFGLVWPKLDVDYIIGERDKSWKAHS